MASIGDAIPWSVFEANKRAAGRVKGEGHDIEYNPVNDLTIWNRWGVNAMRNMAFMRAVEADADRLLILDNDVLLNNESVLELMQTDLPVVTPSFNCMFVTDEDRANGKADPTLSEPYPEPHQGIIQVKWAVASCMMFNREALDTLKPTPFMVGKIASIEEYDCMSWRIQGIETVVDTDIIVGLLRPPTERGDAERAPVQKEFERTSGYASQTASNLGRTVLRP